MAPRPARRDRTRLRHPGAALSGDHARPLRRTRRPRPAPADTADHLRRDPDSLAWFSSLVAHELRNPLSAVKIALQTLERQASLAPKDSTRLRIALREVGTIERVLTDILDWTRPAPLRPEPVDPAALVDAAVALARPELDEQRVQLRLLPLPTCLALWVDPSHAARALAELLRNAALASTAGAAVDVAVRAAGPLTAFEVRDYGPGLGDVDRLRAFEPFFTLRARGIGLGLPLVAQVARAHGGAAELVPAPGGGLVGRLLLPAAARGA